MKSKPKAPQTEDSSDRYGHDDLHNFWNDFLNEAGDGNPATDPNATSRTTNNNQGATHYDDGEKEKKYKSTGGVFVSPSNDYRMQQEMRKASNNTGTTSVSLHQQHMRHQQEELKLMQEKGSQNTAVAVALTERDVDYSNDEAHEEGLLNPAVTVALAPGDVNNSTDAQETVGRGSVKDPLATVPSATASESATPTNNDSVHENAVSPTTENNDLRRSTSRPGAFAVQGIGTQQESSDSEDDEILRQIEEMEGANDDTGVVIDDDSGGDIGDVFTQRTVSEFPQEEEGDDKKKLEKGFGKWKIRIAVLATVLTLAMAAVVVAFVVTSGGGSGSNSGGNDSSEQESPGERTNNPTIGPSTRPTPAPTPPPTPAPAPQVPTAPFAPVPTPAVITEPPEQSLVVDPNQHEQFTIFFVKWGYYLVGNCSSSDAFSILFTCDRSVDEKANVFTVKSENNVSFACRRGGFTDTRSRQRVCTFSPDGQYWDEIIFEVGCSGSTNIDKPVRFSATASSVDGSSCGRLSTTSALPNLYVGEASSIVSAGVLCYPEGSPTGTLRLDQTASCQQGDLVKIDDMVDGCSSFGDCDKQLAKCAPRSGAAEAAFLVTSSECSQFKSQLFGANFVYEDPRAMQLASGEFFVQNYAKKNHLLNSQFTSIP